MIGAATGGAVVSLALFSTYAGRGSPGYVDILLTAGGGGLVIAGVMGWSVTRALANPLRRVMVAMVAVGGATFLAALTTLADTLVPRYGLLGLAALCVLAIPLAYRLFLT